MNTTTVNRVASTLDGVAENITEKLIHRNCSASFHGQFAIAFDVVLHSPCNSVLFLFELDKTMRCENINLLSTFFTRSVFAEKTFASAFYEFSFSSPERFLQSHENFFPDVPVIV